MLDNKEMRMMMISAVELVLPQHQQMITADMAKTNMAAVEQLVMDNDKNYYDECTVAKHEKNNKFMR